MKNFSTRRENSTTLESWSRSCFFYLDYWLCILVTSKFFTENCLPHWPKPFKHFLNQFKNFYFIFPLWWKILWFHISHIIYVKTGNIPTATHSPLPFTSYLWCRKDPAIFCWKNYSVSVLWFLLYPFYQAHYVDK